MTRADDPTAVWVLREIWDAPPEMIAALSDAVNLTYGKSVFNAANGDGRITDAERDWLLGYCRAAGAAQSTIDGLAGYSGDENIEELFVRGVTEGAQRSCICDAIRTCGADGDLAEQELETIHDMARRVGVPAEVVDELVDIYKQEQSLKAWRLGLCFPGGVEPPSG